MNSGVHNTEIIITTNDPVNPTVSVPVELTIIGAPEIAYSNSCIDFGTIMQNTNLLDSIYIYNLGCDTLELTSLNNSLSEYTPSLSSTSFPTNSVSNADAIVVLISVRL